MQSFQTLQYAASLATKQKDLYVDFSHGHNHELIPSLALLPLPRWWIQSGQLQDTKKLLIIIRCSQWPTSSCSPFRVTHQNNSLSIIPLRAWVPCVKAQSYRPNIRTTDSPNKLVSHKFLELQELHAVDKGPNLYCLFISHYKSKCSRPSPLRVDVFSKR